MTVALRLTVAIVALSAFVGYALLLRDIFTITPAQARALADAEMRFEASR